MRERIKFEFKTSLWKHNSPGGWYFISLPKTMSREIRENLKWQEEGWGRMKASAEIREHRWDTAIWFDTKLDTYILPVKAKVRVQTNLKINETIEVDIWI